MTSYNFGPIPIKIGPEEYDHSEKRSDGLVMWEELNFGQDQVVVNDDPVLSASRETGLINFKSGRTGIEALSNFGLGENERGPISLKLLQMSNEGEVHVRMSTQVLTEVSKIGGLSSILLTLGSFSYILAAPIRNLTLAVAFNKMLSSVAQQEGLAKSTIKIDREYEKQINCWFYFNLFLYKRLPKFMHCCLGFGLSHKDG